MSPEKGSLCIYWVTLTVFYRAWEDMRFCFDVCKAVKGEHMRFNNYVRKLRVSERFEAQLIILLVSKKIADQIFSSENKTFTLIIKE